MRLAALLFLFASGCASAPPAASTVPLDGLWRAELKSPGGPLPFGLDIQKKKAWIINGEERAPISLVEVKGRQVVLHIDWYDARIEAELVAPDALTGRWLKTIPGGQSALPFTAQRGQAPRFATSSPPANTVEGTWRVTFSDENGTEPARASLRQEGSTVRGTFSTPTGDYRFLEGILDGPQLKLSTFDGAHAFLFSAKLDGERLSGDFWSRDSYHATWTAERVANSSEAPLPDPSGLSRLNNENGQFRFAFENLEGKTVRSEDPKFEGKVVVVDIFGSWCPNCSDLTQLLVAWDKKHRKDGLRIVGLAFEFGEPKRNREILRKHNAHHGVEYEVLLAGPNDKKIASELLVDLDRVVAYPTLIFIDKKGRVRHIFAGFSGPATPEHKATVAALQSQLERLLAE